MGNVCDDGSPSYDVCGHDGDEEKEVGDPASAFSRQSEQTMHHGDVVGFWRHPRTRLEYEKTRTEHEDPGNEIGDDCGNEATCSRCDGKRKNPNADRRARDEKRSSYNVTERMK